MMKLLNKSLKIIREDPVDPDDINPDLSRIQLYKHIIYKKFTGNKQFYKYYTERL